MRLIDADNLIKDVHEEWDIVQIWDETGSATACEIERLIDAQPTVDQWHYPSKGELPEKGREVWDGYDIVYYLADLKRWCRFDDDEPIKAPYAWCYLPEPPKEEAE